MTTRQLGVLARRWIRRLGLEHWSFTISFGTQKELLADQGEFLFGRVWPDLDTLQATVKIVRPADLQAGVLDALDAMSCGNVDAAIEQTLIHELLHVRLDPSNQLGHDSNFESGLNHTARALYEAHHPKQ